MQRHDQCARTEPTTISAVEFSLSHSKSQPKTSTNRLLSLINKLQPDIASLGFSLRLPCAIPIQIDAKQAYTAAAHTKKLGAETIFLVYLNLSAVSN